MPTEDEIRQWAQVHAAGMRPAALMQPTEPSPATEPVPVVLSSFTETRVIQTDGWTNTVAWAHHPDGRLLLASGRYHGAIQVWDYDTGQLVDTFSGHSNAFSSNVGAVAWNQRTDGRLELAVARYVGNVTIRVQGTNEVVVVQQRSQTPGADITASVAWGRQPDGRPLLAATAGTNDQVTIWDPIAGQTVRTLTGQAGVIRSVALGGTPDRPLFLAVAGSGGIVEIFDTTTWQVLQTLHGHVGMVHAATWARRADGRPLLATAGADGRVRVWAQDAEQFAATVLEPSAPTMLAVAWLLTADGRLLLAASSRNALHLWDGHTLKFLRTVPLTRQTGGYNHLDWTVTPADEVLLAVASRDGSLHIWEAVLDPPVQPPAPPSRTPPRQRRPVRLLDPPEEVTPQFAEVGEMGAATAIVACTTTPDGRLLLATADSGQSVAHLWDLETGRHLHTLTGHSGEVSDAAWARAPDGRLLLATCGDSTTRIWDSSTGRNLQTLTGHSPGGVAVAWGNLPDGAILLASVNDADGTRIWDPITERNLRTIADGTICYAAAWGSMPDGTPVLAIGSIDGTAQIWDPIAGDSLQTLTGHGDSVDGLAWGTLADGSTVLVTGSREGTVRIWDPGTGETLRTLTAPSGNIFAVAWGQAGDGRPLLATAGNQGSARIWDPGTGAELASVPGPASVWRSVAWARDREGNLLLVVANPDPGAGPARVWLVATGSCGAEPHSQARMARHDAGELTRQLLRLGAGGLWMPLSLLADLVTLTGPDGTGPAAAADEPTLCDPGLLVLDGEAGIARLRELAAGQPGWDAEARAAFAALLAKGLDIPAQYAPPPGAAPAVLRQALTQALLALADPAAPAALAAPVPATLAASTALTAPAAPADLAAPASPRPWQAPVTALRAASAAITEQTSTLLAILGPRACAANPLLPARLAHRIPQLPALAPRDLRVLTSAGTLRLATGYPTDGTFAYSPGTAGVARTGPLTRLLPTQLALPRDLMIMRLAEDQLLYRQHRAPAPRSPAPVTIILDTTPPTFGPAGTTLRLAAHLITTTLWEHGRHPALVTLASPHTATELRTPADLIAIWTATTLDDPAGALAAARATAIGTGQPGLLLTHHNTARDHGYRPGPANRLLTTHQPPEAPPPNPVSPWHHHLPPNPTHTQLTTTITQLLTTSSHEDRS